MTGTSEYLNASSATVLSQLERTKPADIGTQTDNGWELRNVPIATCIDVTATDQWVQTGKSVGGFTEWQDAATVRIRMRRLPLRTLFKRKERKATRQAAQTAADNWMEALRQSDEAHPRATSWSFYRSTDLYYNDAEGFGKAIKRDQKANAGPYILRGAIAAPSWGAAEVTAKLQLERASGEKVGTVTATDRDVYAPPALFTNQGEVRATVNGTATDGELRALSNQLNNWCSGRSLA